MGKYLGPGQVNPNRGILKVTYSTREGTWVTLLCLQQLTRKQVIGRLCSPQDEQMSGRVHLLTGWGGSSNKPQVGPVTVFLLSLSLTGHVF